MLCERDNSGPIGAILPGGDLEAEPIHADELGFMKAVAAEGEAFVRQMDEGAVPDAFVAWFEAFNISFAQLQGRDGGEWRLSSELRFKDFLRALGDMQRKKSVGAGGLAVELLIAAGEQVQFAFYNAMISDLDEGRLASEGTVPHQDKPARRACG
jgi:hypothetical protein